MSKSELKEILQTLPILVTSLVSKATLIIHQNIGTPGAEPGTSVGKDLKNYKNCLTKQRETVTRATVDLLAKPPIMAFLGIEEFAPVAVTCPLCHEHLRLDLRKAGSKIVEEATPADAEVVAAAPDGVAEAIADAMAELNSK